MLDPQRFTRGVDDAPEGSRAGDGASAEVRFAPPRRGVPGAQGRSRPDRWPAGRCAELVLWRRLAAYGELRKQPHRHAAGAKAALAKLAFVGLQQRLLSSIAAFVRTLKAHRKTLQRLVDGEGAPGRFGCG